LVIAGEGNDNVYVEDQSWRSSPSSIYGGAGNDILTFGTGYGFVDGGPGDDTITYRKDALGGGGTDVFVLGSALYNYASEIIKINTPQDFEYGPDGDQIRTDGQVFNNGGWTYYKQFAYMEEPEKPEVWKYFSGPGSTAPTVGYDIDFNEPYKFYDYHGVLWHPVFSLDPRFATEENLQGYTPIYQYSGTNQNDVWTVYSAAGRLRGGYGNDTLTGNYGDDTLVGNAGDDVLNGAGGNDILWGYEGHDTLQGGAGNDFLFGNWGNDTLLGGDGDDHLEGRADNDWLEGQLGNDTLLGADGNDTLTGLEGNDSLSGGAGNDLLYSFYGQGPDTLNGGDGIDTLVISRTNLTTAMTVNLSLAAFSLTDSSAISSVEMFNFRAGQGSDSVTGTSNGDTINGHYGNDTLSGLVGNDSLLGDVGNDSLLGGGGTDTLSGGAGSDTLDGGSGADSMDGGGGNDRYRIDSALDAINDTSGIDTVETSITYTLSSVMENGIVVATTSASRTLTGNTLSNALTGHDGVNIIKGGEGNDTIKGMAGADQLFGDSGNDLIYAGSGTDVLWGGTGNDRFGYETIQEISNGATSGFDTIRDLAFGDVIDLSKIDAVSGTPLNEAFAWLGYNAFTGIAGQLHAVRDTINARTLISGDLNGDRITDFNVAITGLPSLTASWFDL
jgi:Ca2+-binding RTX toxin-like protein